MNIKQTISSEFWKQYGNIDKFARESKLNPKKNRWNFGLQFGFGGQYGLINNRFDVGPYFGAGVEFNF